MNHPSEVDIPSDANHQDICKFESPEDRRFIKLQQRIAEKVRVIIRLAEKAKADLEMKKRKEEEEAQQTREGKETGVIGDSRLKGLSNTPSGMLGRFDTCS
jgi:hypothetical protein